MKLPPGIIAVLSSAAVVGAAIAGGCASPPQRPPHAGCARLESLLPLHPNYRLLAGLGRWRDDLRQAGRFPSAAPALPAPGARTFGPEPGSPLQQPAAQAVPEAMSKVIDVELARLARDLDRRMQEELARRRRDGAREVDAQNGRRRVELQREFESARRQALLERRTQVFDLELKAGNLARLLQQPNLGAVERTQTQQRLAAAQDELAQLRRQQAQQIAALEQRHQEQLSSLRRAADEQVARQVEELRQSLARERDQQLVAERARLAAPLAAAERKLTLELDPSAPPAATASPGALEQDFAGASSAVQGELSGWGKKLARGAADVSRRREEFLEFIRRDTRATAEAEARAHGRRITWLQPGARCRKAQDMTAEVEKWLRARWSA